MDALFHCVPFLVHYEKNTHIIMSASHMIYFAEINHFKRFICQHIRYKMSRPDETGRIKIYTLTELFFKVGFHLLLTLISAEGTR